MVALANVRLLAGPGEPLREGVTVLIEDGLIAAIEDAAAARPGATVVDCSARTLMPALIDAHVHLASHDQPDVTPGLAPYALADSARRMLEGGITTVRDLGSYGRALFDLRDAIDREFVAGPRLVLCGQIVAATSPGGRAFSGMYREADGADEMRKATREQIAQGADFIKVMSTGALTVEHEDVNPAQMTEGELRAITDEAHRMGFAVASHAEGVAGIRLSVECGADTIEHGEMGFEDPALLEAMAERGVVLVPTLAVFDAVADRASRFPPWMRERAKFLGECGRKTVAAARSAGVTMAMGADAGPHGENARELLLLMDAGLSAVEAIAAATVNAARACGLEDRLGAVHAGKVADLLVVDGDPLADPRMLVDSERIWLVVREGRAVAGTGVAAAGQAVG